MKTTTLYLLVVIFSVALSAPCTLQKGFTLGPFPSRAEVEPEGFFFEDVCQILVNDFLVGVQTTQRSGHIFSNHDLLFKTGTSLVYPRASSNGLPVPCGNILVETPFANPGGYNRTWSFKECHSRSSGQVMADAKTFMNPLYPSGALPWTGEFTIMSHINTYWGYPEKFIDLLESDQGRSIFRFNISRGSYLIYKVRSFRLLEGGKFPDGIIGAISISIQNNRDPEKEKTTLIYGLKQNKESVLLQNLTGFNWDSIIDSDTATQPSVVLDRDTNSIIASLKTYNGIIIKDRYIFTFTASQMSTIDVKTGKVVSTAPKRSYGNIYYWNFHLDSASGLILGTAYPKGGSRAASWIAVFDVLNLPNPVTNYTLPAPTLQSWTMNPSNGDHFVIKEDGIFEAIPANQLQQWKLHQQKSF